MDYPQYISTIELNASPLLTLSMLTHLPSPGLDMKRQPGQLPFGNLSTLGHVSLDAND